MAPAIAPVGWATAVLPEWRRRIGGQVIEPRLYLPLFMLAAGTEAADFEFQTSVAVEPCKP